jgi:hypothetical protein
MNRTFAIAAALITSLYAVSADAAPFWSVTGGTPHTLPLGATVGSFNPNAGNLGNAVNELIVPFGLEGIVPNPTVVKGGALNLLQNASSLTFTFFGREAGAFNSSFEDGLGSVLNSTSAVGTSHVTGAVSAASPLAFKFTSTFGSGTSVVNGGLANGAGIAFLLSPFNDSVVWAFFDDGGGDKAYKCATGDCDYDDLVIRVQAAAIPLPLPAFLLLGALGSLAAFKRRKV